MFHKRKSKHLFQKPEMLNSNKIWKKPIISCKEEIKVSGFLKKYPSPLRENYSVKIHSHFFSTNGLTHIRYVKG